MASSCHVRVSAQGTPLQQSVQLPHCQQLKSRPPVFVPNLAELTWRKKKRQHLRICNTCCKLLDSRMAFGHDRAKLFPLRHSSSRHRFQGSQRLGALPPAVVRIFMQKPQALLALPVNDFHQRLQVTQSDFKGFLEFRVSSVHGLRVHERLAPPSNCVTCRGVKPMRLDVATVLEDLRKCECRSHSDPTSTGRELLDFLAVHRDQRPPATVRQTHLQQFGSTQGRSIC